MGLPSALALPQAWVQTPRLTPTTLNTDIYSEPYLFDLLELWAALTAKLFSPYCERRWLFTPRWNKETKQQELGQPFPKYPLVKLDWKYHCSHSAVCLNHVFCVQLWKVKLHTHTQLFGDFGLCIVLSGNLFIYLISLLCHMTNHKAHIITTTSLDYSSCNRCWIKMNFL